jgi:hypothetical protein
VDKFIDGTPPAEEEKAKQQPQPQQQAPPLLQPKKKPVDNAHGLEVVTAEKMSTARLYQ